MKQIYTKFGLKLFVIISLLSAGIFAQNAKNEVGSVRWNLTEISGQKVENSKAFLEIDEAKSRLTGNAGCNRMFGEAKVSGKNIKFKKIGTTLMFCGENGLMKLERDFTNALEKVTRFQKNGDILSLYAKNRLILKFKAAEKTSSEDNSSVKLEDRKWVLESIKNNALPKIETAPFINFDQAKQSAGGNTGCNAFGGNYQAKGETIKFSGIISTMRACIEDARMTVEREFKNALEKTDRYQISGGKLKLYQGKNLLLTFRAEAK
jgi:heat shock protein HslJ